MTRISFVFVGLLLWPCAGCESIVCNACNMAQGCPDLSDTYTGDIQLSGGDCGLPSGNGRVLVRLNQTDQGGWSKASFTVVWVAGNIEGLIADGELCASTDGRNFVFNASSSRQGDKRTESYLMGGRIVQSVADGGSNDTHLCASVSVRIDTEDSEGKVTTCSMGGTIFTDQRTCQ